MGPRGRGATAGKHASNDICGGPSGTDMVARGQVDKRKYAAEHACTHPVSGRARSNQVWTKSGQAL
eukprot:9176808-Alexandrium_andersonii.AAC.1